MKNKGTLTNVQGDATNPGDIGKVPIVIPHCCNTLGLWGAGFVLAVDKAFGPKPRESYISWHETVDWLNPADKAVKVTGKFGLGEVQFVKLPNKVVIANMIGQEGVRGQDPTGRPPVRYGALVNCMRHVAEVALKAKADIHCPRFGSDLAGGHWPAIEAIIREEWCDKGINVIAYEFVR